MTDQQDQARNGAQLRDRFRAIRAQIAEVSDEQWVTERDNEVRMVRERAAARRRSAA